MTKEELKNRAKEFVSKIASGTPQEMDYYANLLVEFANETTEELEKENADLKAYNEKLLNSDIEKHNKIVELEEANADLKQSLDWADEREHDDYVMIQKLKKACHKWFKRWREAKKDALYFDSSLQKQIEATYKVVEELNEAKEIIKEFVGWADWQSGGNCPSFKKIQDKAGQFLKEE